MTIHNEGNSSGNYIFCKETGMKRTIIYFVEVFGWGGIETFVSNVCNRLDKNKYNIKIVTVNKISDHFDQILSEQGIELEVLVPKRIVNPMKRFARGLKPFDEYIRQQSDAIVHFNVSNAVDMLYVIIAKNRDVKIRIVHSHNSCATSSMKKIAHYFFKMFLAEIGTVNMACSGKAAKWLFSKKAYKNENYVLVKNAIHAVDYIFDKEKRKQKRQELGWDDKFVVGHIGRFNAQKNHRFLIDIFGELARLSEQAILVLVGEGALEKEIREYVREKNLDDRVVFFGMTSGVCTILQAMDIFLLPSLYEGLPFVLVESQAASLPALVSDVITEDVDISEYITYYSLECSAKEWAQKAMEIAATPRISCAERMIESGFDLSAMVKKLDEIYSEL